MLLLKNKPTRQFFSQFFVKKQKNIKNLAIKMKIWQKIAMMTLILTIVLTIILIGRFYPRIYSKRFA
ncbi:hypothetical protein MOMA_05756 [Moraxella macacae 0408225]|uniref:Uncharacterized protein n=1 Tax=Moraxella macacae 0408225 TaxID=1230338 RepID=L2F5I6_9GAMM|nr:hypothetical protein MOMA_05756 [Moraxella macacae 0408225]